MTLKDFMKDRKKLTLENFIEFAKNSENPIAKKYHLTVADATYYPIPKLEGAYRGILIDQDTVGANDFTLGFARFEPGAYHEPHAHSECEETAYMISGRMVGGVALPGEEMIEVVWEPGDILWVPKGAKHWFYNPFDEVETHVFMYTRRSLKTAGYSLESEGFNEIGGAVEDKRK